MSYIKVIDVHKRYQVGDSTVVANNGVSFSIEKGEFVGQILLAVSFLLQMPGIRRSCLRVIYIDCYYKADGIASPSPHQRTDVL